jgi:hypothetical protein
MDHSLVRSRVGHALSLWVARANGSIEFALTSLSIRDNVLPPTRSGQPNILVLNGDDEFASMYRLRSVSA